MKKQETWVRFFGDTKWFDTLRVFGTLWCLLWFVLFFLNAKHVVPLLSHFSHDITDHDLKYYKTYHVINDLQQWQAFYYDKALSKKHLYNTWCKKQSKTIAQTLTHDLHQSQKYQNHQLKNLKNIKTHWQDIFHRLQNVLNNAPSHYSYH